MNPKGWMLSPGKTLHPVYILDSGTHHDFRPQNRPPYLSRCPTHLPAPSPYGTYPPTPQIYENSMSGMSHQSGVPSQLVSPISGYQHSYSTPVSPYQIPPSTSWVDSTPQYIVQPPLARVSTGRAGTMADSCGIAELKETIKKVNVELIQSHTKISELNAKVRAHEECLSTAQTEMSNLREENAQAQTEMINQREENAQAKTKMNNLREENAQAQRKMSNLRKENAQLASGLKEVSIGSAGTMADSCGIAELKETIEKMNAELIQSHTKISELNAKVREQEECLSAAQTEISNLREENAQAQTEISNLREENAKVQTEMGNLREENAQAQTEMSNLREQNAQAQTEMSNLREQNAQAQTELINLREQNAQAQTEMINLREENAQVQTEMSKLREQNAQSQTEMINLREQNAQAQTEMNNLREENAQATTEMNNLREQNAQAQTEMINLREQNAQAQAEMINLREQNAQAQAEMINLREQNAQAQAEMINLQEENAQLASRLKESEDKCSTVQERLELAEQKLAQFSQKPNAAAEECLAQISFPLVEKDGNSGVVKYDSNIKHPLKRKKPNEETKENNVKTVEKELTSILKGDSKTKKKLKLSKKKEKSCPSNTHLICNKEVVIQLERIKDSTVAETTACGSALPPQQTKKKLKLSKKKEKSYPSNPHLICNKEDVMPFERLNDSTVAEMTACGSAFPLEQTKKKLTLSKKKEKSYPSNPHLICNKEDMIPFKRLKDSTVAEMTACGSALPPEQTKKKLTLSKKKEKSYPSNPHLICNKEDMIPFKRLKDSTVAEMTACGSALPPEQKKLKLLKKKEKSYPSNPHLICNKEDVMPFERLNDSTVAEMTACGSAFPPEQTKKKLKLSKKNEKSYPSNPHLICNKEDMIPFERLKDSTVTEMTASGSALPPEQTKKKLKLSKKKEKSYPSNPHLICNKEDMIPFERLKDSTVAEITACGSAFPPEQTKKKLKLSKKKEKSYPSKHHLICNKEDVISFESLNDSTVAEMSACGSGLLPEQVNESNDNPLGINSLPDKIIKKIFGFFTQNQLGQIARVCRKWNVLAKSPVWWRKVNVKIFTSDTEKSTVAKSFIKGLPSCVTFIRLEFPEFVSLEFSELDFDELSALLEQNCPHVEEFILARCVV